VIILRCDAQGCGASVDTGAHDGDMMLAVPGWKALHWFERGDDGILHAHDFIICPRHELPPVKSEVLEPNRAAIVPALHAVRRVSRDGSIRDWDD
jgi:hypothetical protein